MLISSNATRHMSRLILLVDKCFSLLFFLGCLVCHIMCSKNVVFDYVKKNKVVEYNSNNYDNLKETT